MAFASRLRAHTAGLEDLSQRLAAGAPDAADLLALAQGPLPLLGALVAQVAPRQAAVVGLLPVQLGADVEETVREALAHRSAREAEVIAFSAQAPCATGALDQLCEVARRLLAGMPGATARIDEGSLQALAAGAGLAPEGAAARLQQAGIALVTAPRLPGAAHLRVLPSGVAAATSEAASSTRTEGAAAGGNSEEIAAATSGLESHTQAGGASAPGAAEEIAAATPAPGDHPQPGEEAPAATSHLGPLPIRERWEVPPAIDDRFVQALLTGPRRSLSLHASPETTGIVLIRAVALARLAGHGPIAVGGEAELKGPDACLAFGADTLEAELDPAGSMGSRTRAYGEAAIRGAQLSLVPPRRRMAPGPKAAHILDEDVDPSLLPGGAGEEIH